MRGPAQRFIILASAVALASLATTPLGAHHGAAAFFDTTKTITVKGTMTDFLYVNPHVQLYFEVRNEKGETERWQGELTAPSKLSRAGWTKRTLQAGDVVTVTGNPAKNGTHTIWIRKLIDPKGESLQLFED